MNKFKNLNDIYFSKRETADPYQTRNESSAKKFIYIAKTILVKETLQFDSLVIFFIFVFHISIFVFHHLLCCHFTPRCYAHTWQKVANSCHDALAPPCTGDQWCANRSGVEQALQRSLCLHQLLCSSRLWVGRKWRAIVPWWNFVVPPYPPHSFAVAVQFRKAHATHKRCRSCRGYKDKW